MKTKTKKTTKTKVLGIAFRADPELHAMIKAEAKRARLATSVYCRIKLREIIENERKNNVK